MQRRTLNASRLREEVSRRIHRLQEVVDDGVKIGVPRPQHQAPARDGCNWTMRHFGNAAGFEASVAGVLEQMRAEYNLADDEAGVADAGDPFGGGKPAAAANPFGDAKPATTKTDPFGGGNDADATSATDPFDGA